MSDEWPEIVLDGSDWQTSDDVYDAFLSAVQAPDWHGRNLAALNDSIGTGNINDLELPYRLRISGGARMADPARAVTEKLVVLMGELAAGGVPIAISLEP